jgi:hypothetical protein
LSDEERARKYYYDDKKKWINQKGFKKYFGNAKSYFIPTYVVRTPGEIPLLHKFRTVEKNRWVGGKNFSL